VRHYLVLTLLAGLLFFPASTEARSNAGCLQKQLATAVQGTKMMVRCYGLAARNGEPIENSCLEKAARRMKITFSRLSGGGCPEVPDADQIVAETIGYMNRLTSLLSQDARSEASAPAASAAPVADVAATPVPATN
jgi:hypothetical protein